MHCMKLKGQSPMAKDFDRQAAEIQARITVLNHYTALGIPITGPPEKIRPGKEVAVTT